MSDTDDYLKTLAHAAERQMQRQEKQDRDADLMGAAARERADQALDHLRQFSGMVPDAAGTPTESVLVLALSGPMAQGGIAVAYASDSSFASWRTLVQLAKEAYAGRSYGPQMAQDIAIPYRDPHSGELGAIYASVLAGVVAISPRSANEVVGTAVIVPR
ncbi:MAG TPA: hypothetical protein VMU89_14915 [Thermomicrobiaceae bacterium]|nr:hypothetical protein [Thermomicrobiaceae bacterium]